MFNTLEDYDFHGKKTILRVDFNVPLDKHGNVVNDKRIRAALPSIKYLLSKGARLILLTHVGRPKGQVVEELRTHGIAKRLSAILGRDVRKLSDVMGEHVKEEINAMKDGEIILLENIRFYKQEKGNDEFFAKQLAELADVYVNDAFGVAHREHTSVVGIPKHLPSCAGFIIENEIKMLNKAIENPKRPYVAIVGGAKEDKIKAIKNLLPKVDHLIISGKLANTFLKAKGVNIGASAYDENALLEAREILALAEGKIILPKDVIIADRFHNEARIQTMAIENIPTEWMALDVGPETIRIYKQLLDTAETIVWTGPIGVFELEQFANGTKQVAFAVAASNATTIIGGGDSAAAIEKYNLQEHMSIVSTGGGASLKILQGKTLVGIDALRENKHRNNPARVSPAELSQMEYYV